MAVFVFETKEISVFVFETKEIAVFVFPDVSSDWVKLDFGSSGIHGCDLGIFPGASSPGITQPRILQSSWHGEELDVNLALPLDYFPGCSKILPQAGLWMEPGSPTPPPLSSPE